MSAREAKLSDEELDKIARVAGVSRATVERVLALRAKARNRRLAEAVRRLLAHAVDTVERELVYFVQAEHRGRIKIGTTKNLDRRIKVLRAGSPVELHVIGIARGGRRLEQMLHIAFAPLRRGRTEWFEPGESLLSYIRDLQQQHGESGASGAATKRSAR